MINFGIYLCGLFLIFTIVLIGQQTLLFQSGMLFLGAALFFSLGAYCSTILSIYFGLPVFAAVIIASIIVGALAYLIGYPLLRALKYDYFALVTLSLTQINFVIIRSIAPGGVKGIAVIPSLQFTSENILPYQLQPLVIVILFTIFSFIFSLWIQKIRLGKLIEAVRLDENVVSVLGYSPLMIKTQAFTFAGILAAGAGALQAHYIGAIDPSLSSIQETVLILCGTIVSGKRSVFGVLIGATIVIIAPEIIQRFLISEFFVNWSVFPLIQIIYGIIIIIVALTLFPQLRSSLKTNFIGK